MLLVYGVLLTRRELFHYFRMDIEEAYLALCYGDSSWREKDIWSEMSDFAFVAQPIISDMVARGNCSLFTIPHCCRHHGMYIYGAEYDRLDDVKLHEHLYSIHSMLPNKEIKQEVKERAKLLGIEKVITTYFLPECNGQCL